MKFPLFLLLASAGYLACNEQPATARQAAPRDLSSVGGPFENRELTYIGMPQLIASVDTSPGWKQQGQHIRITGTVFRADGKTPAPSVILYYYHTDTSGQYRHRAEVPRSMAPNQQGTTHGYIRGWVKTDSLGRYALYTVRPGIYPTRDAPAHIHAAIVEPNGIPEYYVDDFLFDDDPVLSSEFRKRLEQRGGNGILRLRQEGDLYTAERNITLGLNIPAYPR